MQVNNYNSLVRSMQHYTTIVIAFMFMASVNPGSLSWLTTLEMDGHLNVESFNKPCGKLRMRGVLNLTFTATWSGTTAQVICIETFPLSDLATVRAFIHLFIYLFFSFPVYPDWLDWIVITELFVIRFRSRLAALLRYQLKDYICFKSSSAWKNCLDNYQAYLTAATNCTIKRDSGSLCEAIFLICYSISAGS